ncbi:hypothetical protein QR680_004817 [Steinernema hermaphroditum]|uniref:Uncharacterized protein n=1 Tax=Steinernema hermaphroditum TaxID=289476 RepID=A0AA39HS79_9BILA|nr:hypothetical protein QR680_004817 [Steinernema hermaphroditum]
MTQIDGRCQSYFRPKRRAVEMTSTPFKDLLHEWVIHFHEIVSISSVLRKAVAVHNIELDENMWSEVDLAACEYALENVSTNFAEVYDRFRKFISRKVKEVAQKIETGYTEEQIRSKVFQFSFDPEVDLCQDIDWLILNEISQYDRDREIVETETAEIAQLVDNLAKALSVPEDDDEQMNTQQS